ncbi:hypothetical protein [Azospirillum sp. sgz301742]
MTIAAVPLDSAAVRPASAPLSAIVRSPTEEPYNEKADMSFGDFLDMINPLQHIPVVGTIYRAVTGDTIKPAAQVIGDIAYGGPIGGITSIFSAIIAQANGRSMEDAMLAGMGLGGEQPTVAVAEAKPTAAAPSPQPAPVAPAPTVTQVAALAAAPAPAPLAGPTAAPTPASASGSAAAPQPAAGSRLTDKPVSSISEHKPSKMPARDTVLANTMQSKQVAALTTRATPMPPKGPAVAPSVAANANTNAANTNAPNTNTNGPVPQEMISDVMMRNLAKYEAAKKALNPTTPNIRVAG